MPPDANYLLPVVDCCLGPKAARPDLLIWDLGLDQIEQCTTWCREWDRILAMVARLPNQWPIEHDDFVSMHATIRGLAQRRLS